MENKNTAPTKLEQKVKQIQNDIKKKENEKDIIDKELRRLSLLNEQFELYKRVSNGEYIIKTHYYTLDVEVSDFKGTKLNLKKYIEDYFPQTKKITPIPEVLQQVLNAIKANDSETNKRKRDNVSNNQYYLRIADIILKKKMTKSLYDRIKDDKDILLPSVVRQLENNRNTIYEIKYSKTIDNCNFNLDSQDYSKDLNRKNYDKVLGELNCLIYDGTLKKTLPESKLNRFNYLLEQINNRQMTKSEYQNLKKELFFKATPICDRKIDQTTKENKIGIYKRILNYFKK